MLGVLLFDTLPGLFIGIATSLVLLVYRASQPNVAVLGRPRAAQGHWVDVERHPEDEQVPGIVVLRVEAGLFFANAEHVRATLLHAVGPDTRALVLDAQTVPFIDVTAAEMLLRLREDLAARGVAVVMARGVGQVRDVLERSAESEELLPGVYPTVSDAVAALQAAGPTTAS
jgi:MFS superfamily sulfate permease-like transporter